MGGGPELVDGFYDVLCRNMRDLGTPVFGKWLFGEILAAFPDEAEICLVRDGSRPVATALLISLALGSIPARPSTVRADEPPKAPKGAGEVQVRGQLQFKSRKADFDGTSVGREGDLN